MNELIIAGKILEQVNLSEDIFIRKFIESDFPLIQALFEKEGWMTIVKWPHEGLEAWKNSTITLVAFEGDKVIGAIRALTDKEITTYIAEIIVDINYRGKGIGKALLDICHNMYPHTRFDLLSTEGSEEFYKKNNFKNFIGFRKSYYEG